MQGKRDAVKGSSSGGRLLPPDELASRVLSLSGTLQRSIASALTEKGLGVPQWQVVNALARGSEGRTMSELSSSLGIPAASLTRIIDGLVDRALVHRTLDGMDRRRVLVGVTERGRVWHGQAASRISEALDPKLGALADWEAATLAALLEKIS
ncbi:MarR family transcriptional regulator [Janibacter sp. LM]|uniref:MarR family winged helix-turn-helix transcriptional regulator n=1 Tax=Janibacter sp. LM TaxID=3144845 RepID=UPI0031F63862|nr:MarR family transcriptional regulator [Kytococcus sp.]